MNTTKPATRRNFLKAAASTAIAAPMIVPSSVFGANAPSNRVALGHIGVGGQGGGLLGGFLNLPNTQCLATCDPIASRREAQAKRIDSHYAKKTQDGAYTACRAYNDFRDVLARDDIDAVIVGTPDHWHVPISLAAVQAGKDVYCEKPLGISIAQNRTLRDAVHRYGAVFQYGTQQRGFNTHCARVCELVRAGAIGDLKAVHVVAPNGNTGGNPTPQPVPDGLDYDMWLGPAPVKPFTHDRVFGVGRWMIYDYALGFIAGWGAHPLDIAHWGYPHIPVEYEGTGIIPTEGLFDTVVNWDVKGRYASGVEFTLKTGGDRTTFVGTEGTLWASRGGAGSEPANLLQTSVKPGDVRLLQDTHHYRNFISAVLSRSTPASDIDSAVQSDIMSHLGDIAIRTGRKIRWDPVQEGIVDDAAAARMTHRPMRAPWTV